MAKLVFALNQSLDGYVDHTALGPPERRRADRKARAVPRKHGS